MEDSLWSGVHGGKVRKQLEWKSPSVRLYHKMCVQAQELTGALGGAQSNGPHKLDAVFWQVFF